MIAKATFDFIKALTKNNNKPWFDANRTQYEAARENIKDAVTLLIPQISAVDKSIADAHVEPKNCMFRINRDVRFSKEKHPYKNNMAMQFNPYGKSLMAAGYYVHIQPGACFLGGGIWMPMAPELKKIRQEIDYNLADFKKILTNKKFVACFGATVQNQQSLTRPPKGYTDDNPALPYLKLKNFVAMQQYTDAEMMDTNMAKNLVKSFEAMQPFIAFLNRAILP